MNKRATLSQHSDEFALIGRVFGDCPAIGDDAAVLSAGRLIATDTLVESVHFSPGSDPVAIGHKAIAVNLSDIAAMGGQPTEATVGLSVGDGWELPSVETLLRSLRATAERFGCTIVGGDTTHSHGPLVITVTVLGTAERAVLRSGGRPGDRLVVTGELGRSFPTGHHLTFEPRLDVGRRLAEAGATAMIDLSDGLSSDLHHLCTASGCGAVIDACHLPSRDNATLDEMLGDGEDFELLAALPEGVSVDGTVEIGRLTDTRSVRLATADGDEVELMPRGYSHRLSRSK